MKLAELRQAIRAADPSAILVAPHVLDQVIQQEGQLSGFHWDIPHRHGFVVDRHLLFRHVEQDDLDLEPDRLLPATVILLARPSVEQLTGAKRDDVLVMFWRRLFHANLHLALNRQVAEGRLSLADIHQRIDQIGQAEFEEIRLVLEQDDLLLPPRTEQSIYIEFAAVFLELRYFAANLLPIYFPAINDLDRVERLLTRDLDTDALFTQTRLEGAPMPVVRTDPRSDESHDYYWRLMRHAERASRTGNTVRAAIVRTRAARVAPAALTAGTQAEAEEDLKRLTARLQSALQLSEAEAGEWLKDLPALLDKADQGNWPVEAALLYDLQKVCLDHEGDIYALDLVEWALSLGKRPIKRPLPSQRLVRIIKHLRSATQRLTRARLSDVERQHLAHLLETALNQSEERLRERFRPVLADALQDVDLRPGNPPERTAFRKMIEEMLDRIAEYGFLTFSDLRDVISRNQLKMADPADPQEFVRGDPLLRLDRRLATLLDGVYRPADFYLRWLERFTALGFATRTGRWLTRFVTVPFGGAAIVLEGAQFLLDKSVRDMPIFAPVSSLVEVAGDSRPRDFRIGLLTWVVVGFLLLGLIHVPALRNTIRRVGRMTFRFVRGLVIDVPAWLLRIPLLRRVLNSWVFQLFNSYLVKPLLACGLLWLWEPSHPLVESSWGAATTFLAVNFVLNSRVGKAAGNSLKLAVVKLAELLGAGLIPGLFRLVVRLFKQILDMVDYVLFTVDEWLRFRAGDSQFSLVVRTVLGVLWFPISYLARFYTVVLIEPGFNPVKAPVSYLAAKFIAPFSFVLTTSMANFLAHVVGPVVALVIAAPTVWLLADAFGFLFWEMKENWSLYRANRRSTLGPVSVGPHGETVRQLLQPGFHSGTVPRLFARLRRTEAEALTTSNWRAARINWNSVQEVRQRLRRLVDRELVTLLQQSPRWLGQRLHAGPAALALTRIRFELQNEAFPTEPVYLELEFHAGWLVGCVKTTGWLDRLTPEQRQAAATALAGFYKLAGVDLVREQVRANLPAAVPGYEVTARGLLLWPNQRNGQALVYDLQDAKGTLKPRTLEGAPAPNGPVLDVNRVSFTRVPIYWTQWVETWEQEQNGKPPRPLFSPDVKLLPAPAP